MKKNLFRVFSVLWVAVMALLGLYFVFLSPRESSFDESENRQLAEAPALTAENVLGGGLSEGVENWMADHVPQRRKLIVFHQRLRDTLSLASYEDSLAVVGTVEDRLSMELNDAELDALAAQMLAATRAPTFEPTPLPELTPTPEPTPEPEATPEPTPVPTPTPVPKNPEKPAADPDDYPDSIPLHLEYDNKDFDKYVFAKNRVLAVASVLDRLAALLPEDGTLVYTMVPQSSVGNLFVYAEDKRVFTCGDAALIEAVCARNAHAVSATDILAEAIKEGQYVYFRTDMHWTPLGTYLVYRDMVELAGLEPVVREDCFDFYVETPFRGTYYRDNPTSWMRDNPDDLELVRPRFQLEWRRITSPEEYKTIPFLDKKARSNDRYTIYLGGPAGPWTYAQCDNGQTDNCLVITDSFGLAFVPLMTQHYAQVHYYDPRYFDGNTVGGSVADMIERYEIKDVYVVVGDLHSYESDFLIYQVSSQLGDN